MGEPVGFLYAHPDDETFLSACLIRQLADEGHAPVLLLATKGEAGQKNGYAAQATKEELAVIRVKEMEKAAAVLGIAEVEHLGFPDGKLDTVDETLFLDAVIGFINKHRLRIVVTFPEDGGNFHPDHMAISRFATAAVLSGRCPSVQKLYYIRSKTLTEQGYEPTLVIDTEQAWSVKAEALRAHTSQLLAIERYFGNLDVFPENRRYESFVLNWERGQRWPSKTETSLFDGLL
ncbi:GlcNAc-PI de-N-acetylase [Paenibacillus tyrfis]|uniref:PIG-L deacetylase family protein n=1 Tax=Paenibacillus tyrfis TaxID=1501230 RepID=UPI002493C595|nr:PIG-L family deacetylase [Paenibacillus tyrfis]GLI10500.1 GlcNAc-PI de-N-acetylase [Paenibacillus tyrfis]